MKRNILKGLALGLGMVALYANESKAQCGTETFATKNWCENGFAQWTITNPEPDVKYHWYEPVYDALGNIQDTLDRYYGADATGTKFVSPYRYTTPTPTPTTPGWDERKFWYVKETATVAGPSSPATDIGNPGANTGYTINFTTSERLRFNSITIPIHSYYMDPNFTYYVQIRIGTKSSPVYNFKFSDVIKIGALHLLKVPVNLDIPLGANTIEVVTNPTGGTGNQISNLEWFAPAQFSFPLTSTGGITITGSATSNSNKAMVFDWDVTAYCPYTFTPASKKNTNPASCCTPLTNSIIISSIDDVLVSSGPNASTLDLSVATTAADPVNHFFAWYLDGALIDGPVQGLVDYTVNKAGTYEVREVIKDTDIDDVSCYSTDKTQIQERVLFAKNNTPKASYCIGESIEVEATGDIVNLNWGPAGYFSNPTSKKTLFTPTAAATNVTIEATANVVQGNLIINGDFENGSTGFTSNLTPSPGTGGFSSNNYRIGTYVTQNQSYWNADPAQPPTSAYQCRHDGNFFYADGFNAGSSDPIIWRQKVNVTKNLDYDFSMDHSNISWNQDVSDPARVADVDATFDVYINGALQGSFTTDGRGEKTGVCRWKTDKFSWNSQNNTSADIVIKQKVLGSTGYDFAIDNIKFGGPAVQTAKINIGPIKDCYELTASKTACQLDSVILSAKGINTATNQSIAVIDRWEKLDGTLVGKGTPISVRPTVETDYVVYGYFPTASIIQNGDFEFGVNGFKYGNTNGLYDQGNSPGSFSVLKNPSLGTACNNFCQNMGDHTSGTGNMLFVDPKSDDGNVISYDFTAGASKKYGFSLWVANAVNFLQNTNGKASSISFIVNGPGATNQQIASVDLPKDNVWRELSSVWTAPQNGNYTLTIRAKGDNSLTGSGGNDFVMDDIKMATLLDNVYKDTVTVQPCISCNKPKAVKIAGTKKDSSMCQGGNLALRGTYTDGGITPNGVMSYVWYKKGASPGAYAAIPATGVPDFTAANVGFSGAGTYVLRVQDGTVPNNSSCYTEDTLKIRVDTIPTFTVKNANLCDGKNLKLDTLVTGLLSKSATLKFYSDTTGAAPTALASSTITTPGTYYAKAVSSLVQCSRSFKYGAIVVGALNSPSITKQPAETGGCVGSTTSLDVTATGTAPLKYQWNKRGAVTGKDSAGIYFGNLSTADSASYYVIVSNGCGNVQSNTVKVKITLNDDPRVTLTVNKDVVCTDSTVLLTATPSGGGRDFKYTFMNGATAISPVDQDPSTFRTSGLTANASFTVVMNYFTPCPIAGAPNNGSVTSDPKTVQVDQYVSATVGTPNPKLTCADEVQLPGGMSPSSINTAIGTWSISATSPDLATIQNPSSPTSNLSNITPNSTVDLLWVVGNGVCPKDTAEYQVKQVGTITKARIRINGGVHSNSDRTNRTADSLCIVSNYALFGTDPLKSGESRKWTLESAGNTGIVLGTVDAVSQAVTATATDTAVISYVILPSLSGCPSDSATITLIFHDKPSVTSLTVPTVMPCEGAVDTDTVFAQYSSSLIPSFSWSMTTGGTGNVTIANDSDTIAVLNSFASNATTGWKDSVTINAKVSNVCGSNSASNKVVFKLKPRDFAIGDSIVGPTIFCESSPYMYNHFGQKQPNTDSIRWYWNDVYQGTTVNDPGNPKDTMWFNRNKTWGDISTETYANVKAQLGNECGYYATMTRKDTIIPAVEFNFHVVSDKIQNSFCVPLDLVGVWAQQAKPDSMNYGNVAQYAFKSSSGAVLQQKSTSRALKRRFAGDTTIWVVAYPERWACLSSYAPDSLPIDLKGFDKPIDTLSYSDTVFCEGANTAQLFISPKSKNVGDFTWYRVDGGGANSINKNNQNPLSLSSPSESGSYYAVIENALKKIDPNTSCPGATTKTVSIKIFDRPDPLISPNPLLIYYEENSPGVKMPLITVGTADSVFDIHYSPGTWLSTTDSLVPTIKTTKEEIEMEYVLTLYSGIKGSNVTCPGTTSVRIINTLPLRIPNAFSPNGDGKNETWIIEGLGKYPNTRVKVFNRWGSAVFTDNYGYSVPWDGSHNGVQLPNGTYYYVINLLGSPDGKEEVQTGSLTIVR